MPIPLKGYRSGSSSRCPGGFLNWDVEPYSQQRDRAVMDALKKGHSSSSQNWDQLLNAPRIFVLVLTSPTRFILPLAQLGSKLKAAP